ncbi:hypothetical protein [Pseudomonas sp. R2-37-08W]|uniref:hypothetical protein n=1 Tax=Pseudomonas sp. R2-37-08W TaxID=1173273 RepID=UPI000F564EC5|nr:hypothetical protein [Pseudomonas sp. R2-37-08W]
MSTEKNSPLHRANIRAVVNKKDVNFSPDQFDGSSSRVRMEASFDSTYLEIDYGAGLTSGTHTLPHTQFKVKYRDPAGQDFTHVAAGTLVVEVIGNTHNGELTDIKVDGTGSGAGSTLQLSGDYLIVVS